MSYIAACYWRESDEVWLAKLRAYAASLPTRQEEMRTRLS
jgi:hypothetical protein